MIREGGMVPVNYIQPAKPDNSGLENISALFGYLRSLGTLYVDYKMDTEAIKPTIRSTIIGICNYLRQSKYSNVLWCASLLNPIELAFVEYVQNKNEGLYSFLDKYIYEDADKNIFSTDLRDSGNGVIDLATGMADTTAKLTNLQSSLNNHLITQTAYETIGNVASRCNFCDFCCDFDAIKIAQLISEMESDKNRSNQSVTGTEFADILETYYNGLYLDRFKYIFSDLECSYDDLEVILRSVYSKMNGIDETLVLLPSFGRNPDSQVNM